MGLINDIPPYGLADPVVSCPNCRHGIDPHGLNPGGLCAVGSCSCLWSPNDIALHENRTVPQ